MLQAFEEAKIKDKLLAEQEEARNKAEWAAEAAAAGASEDHDFRKLSRADRLKYANKNKTEANELFKDGNYARAVERYIKALGHTQKIDGAGEEADEAELRELQAVLHSNLAMAYLKLKLWPKALHAANSVLELDKDNAKGVYRRALALEGMKDYDGALQTLAGKEDDAACAKLQKRLKAKADQERERQKKMYSKMFS